MRSAHEYDVLLNEPRSRTPPTILVRAAAYALLVLFVAVAIVSIDLTSHFAPHIRPNTPSGGVARSETVGRGNRRVSPLASLPQHFNLRRRAQSAN